MLDVCTMRLLSERGKVSRKSGILFVLPVYRGKSCLFASFLGTYIRGAFNSRKDCPRRIVTSLFLSRFYRRTLMICETFCGVRVFFFLWNRNNTFTCKNLFWSLYITRFYININFRSNKCCNFFFLNTWLYLRTNTVDEFRGFGREIWYSNIIVTIYFNLILNLS